ncbi:MAG: hypothetical protein CSA22_07855 [Deltaproteobacteria bacterium]|nr:MAG: hypothetical protein CSA22_07855 [Deltaproteobacteria bacterium]
MLKFSVREYLITVCCGLVFFISGVPAAAEPVDTYDALYEKLPGSLSSRTFNTQAIEHAQEFIKTRQLAQRRRVISFVKPIDIFFLNEKYISVSFELTVKPQNQKAIIAVLLENLANKRVKFYNGLYILWIGEKDLSDYQDVTSDQLCKYYQEIGAKDCKPAFRRSRLEAAVSAKSDIGHTHDISEITGTIPENRIDDNITRDSELEAALAKKVDLDTVQRLIPESTNENVDQSYVESLEKRIALLEAELAKVTPLLKGMVRAGNTLILTNMNLQIVNGKGKTESTNGNGNLIIGYNESKDAKHSGSHNIVVGPDNTYTSYGGIVTGRNNAVSGKYAVAVGGENQSASGDYSGVFGGKNNKATGPHTSVSGGRNRTVAAKNPHFIQQ